MLNNDKEEVLRKKYQNRFVSEWQIKEFFDTGVSAESIISIIKSSEELGLLGGSVAMILKNNEYTPVIVYISKNVEKLFSYKVQEIKDKDIFAIFDIIDLQHIDFAAQLLDWSRDFEMLKEKKAITSAKGQNFFCGLKIRLKNGEPKTCFVKQLTFQQNKNIFPDIAVYFISDITHLYKADFFWAQFTAHDEQDNVIMDSYYTSSEEYKKISSKTILSKRETEILNLIASGMDTKEIGKTLFISTGTVEQHRKKMIAKSGVRDTIALIEIAKKSKLLNE